MPKYKVTFYETYYAITEHIVEANNELEAEELADNLESEHTTDSKNIEFIEYEYYNTEKISD